MLVRLIYASRMTESNPDVLNDIVSLARSQNPINGITGLLCHGGGIFLQALEGSRTAVNTLYCNIIKDTRHVDVTLLHYEEIVIRQFGGWTMGHVDLTKAHLSLLLR